MKVFYMLLHIKDLNELMMMKKKGAERELKQC